MAVLHDSLEAEIQNAVDQTGYGKFHYKVFTISLLIFMNTGFGVSSTGLIVPAAQCDFEMTTMDIGRLTAAPMLGMVCGSYFWGCLADMKGRKAALLGALFLDGIAGLLSSFVPNFWVFTCLRFLNGFAITGQSAMVFPYLGEFQPTRLREQVLAWMEMAWTMGLILLPLLGWLIIPMDFVYTWCTFSLASWNLFVFLCALLPLSIAIAFMFFPESPKYLMEDGQESRAMRILARMYAENTGNPVEDYPVKFVGVGDSYIDDNKNVAAPIITKRKKKVLSEMLKDIAGHTLEILKPPHLSKTVLIASIQFSMTLSYYTLMVWFPEIFQRFALFEEEYPEETGDVCTITTTLFSNETLGDFGCGIPVSQSVYIFTIFLGLACIPTSIWLPLCIGRLGYRFFLVFSTTVAGAVAVGMLYVTSGIQNLVLSCIFEALTSMGVSVVYCILVDFYPTKLRVVAASFSALCGRTGALIGNLIFGSLLDLNCIIPIALVGVLLLFAAMLSLFLPSKGKDTTGEETSAVANNNPQCKKCACKLKVRSWV